MDIIYWSVCSSSRRRGKGVKRVDGGYFYLSQHLIRVLKIRSNNISIRNTFPSLFNSIYFDYPSLPYIFSSTCCYIFAKGHNSKYNGVLYWTNRNTMKDQSVHIIDLKMYTFSSKRALLDMT